MHRVSAGSPAPLTALMIAPNRVLAEEFTRTVEQTRAFQILADLRAYPNRQTLEIRLRQLVPDVLLLDLATDFQAAAELISAAAAFRPSAQVVGLHLRNDSEVILRSLRLGAAEFLYSPFEPAVQQEAIARLRRLCRPRAESARPPGKIAVFSSAKPGSGASTLASQTAFAIRRLTSQRVLLVDLDLMGGTISFYLKVEPNGSLLEALEGERFEPGLWTSLINHLHGLDVLPAPKIPRTDSLAQARFHEFCEYARRTYDWILLDVPAIFHRLSLLAFSESDCAFLVSTPDLPSLHLARKAVKLLGQLGFDKQRFQIVMNRVGRGDGLRNSDIEKILDHPVHASFSNDYISVDRIVALGQPLDADSELGKAIDQFAARLAGRQASGQRGADLAASPRLVFSGV